ncbi:hypothetical protein GCM10010124_16360 [Pilimelia terevasa]|uniref:Uncharacterized protein n=1 Tax=Pilimelia terevasa TaxID=53372 RepID=A0A8J3BIT4_9ACTN|nr:hypothetical protein [Pilimelia terevasa]GGK24578.1 hypothetical protein GCM10010124_16360 [Pilimelia terevasa]
MNPLRHTTPSAETVAWRRRRLRFAIGGALGGALIGGAALVLYPFDDRAADSPAPPPAAAPAPDTAAGGTGTAAASDPTAATRPRAAAASPTRRMSTRERIAAAKAAPHVPAAAPQAPVPDNDSVSVVNTGQLRKDRRTLRVVSARADLTGQRELAWIADEGRPVGNARCTQKFQFSSGRPAAERPTLLMCWRTSAARSAYTILVDLSGRPSAADSLLALDRAWSRLT